MLKGKLAAVATTVCLASATAATGAIIHVPADQPTIQAGVDFAGTFDTVIVAPGIYQENVLIHTKWIYLTSHYFLDGNPTHLTATIIDGSTPSSPDSGSAIRLVEAGNAVVTGFTITGGTGTVWLDVSDGLLYREGGGILTEGGSPRIHYNLIIGNVATEKVTGVRSAGGGAIRCGFGSAEITNNVIAYNEARYGAGVVVFHNPSVIRNNLVFANRGGSDFGGGGLWMAQADVPHLVENNTIVGNSSALDGGGILLWGNDADVHNNILWGNTAATSGPQMGLRAGTAGTTVSYSDVEGGFTGLGIIDHDPAFAHPSYYLGPGTPCVDSGNPTLSYNDPPDTVTPSLALPPSQGGRRNDQGAFGGPATLRFPSFNEPGVGLWSSVISFDSVTVGDSATVALHISKAAFGLVRIESLTVAGNPLGAVESHASLPFSMGPMTTDSLDSIDITWAPNTYGELRDTVRIYHTDPTVALPLLVELVGTAPGMTGDVNLDGFITAADLVYLVNYAFKSGAPPLPVPESGDVDCDGAVNASDLVYLVNHIFKSGAPPCN